MSQTMSASTPSLVEDCYGVYKPTKLVAGQFVQPYKYIDKTRGENCKGALTNRGDHVPNCNMRGAYGRDRDMRINGACQIPVLLVDEVVKQVKEAMNRTDAEKVRVTGPMLLLKEAIPGFEPEEKAIDNNMAALEDFKKRLLQTIAECSVIARCPFLPDEDSE